MSETLRIQTRLKELGFDPGPLDGLLGDKTREAVKAFQRSVGISVDGKPGPQTQAKLFVEEPIPGRDVDPPTAEPAHVKPIWPRQADVPSFYGLVGSNQTTLHLPFPMRIAWEPAKIVSKFSVHAKVHDSALRAFEKIAATYGPADRSALGIDLWGGCLNVRPMRGGTRYSMHSWGIAIDFDPERNQLRWGRDRARLAHPDAGAFWQAWEAEGWVSLGRTRNMDWMHVQAARL